LLGAFVNEGVTTCFANPGTTELDLVSSLGRVRMRAVLALDEGVVTGAADGWGRMMGSPALALMHLGPGLANGLANLHNARRARTPVVALVGDHASWHVASDPPLATDIVELAGPMSRWVGTVRPGAALAECARAAVAAARWGGVATLILPQDAMWASADEPRGLGDSPEQRGPDPMDGRPAGDDRSSFVQRSDVDPPGLAPDVDLVREAAAMLRRPGAVLLIGGGAMSAQGIADADAIAGATGCRLLGEAFSARAERGRGIPLPQRIPYPPGVAVGVIAQPSGVVLAGAAEPVAFFGYPDGPSVLLPAGTPRLNLAGPTDDAAAALGLLAAATDASPRPVLDAWLGAPLGPLTVESLGMAIAATQPEGAIVVEEGLTSGGRYAALAAGAPPHSALMATMGGAIGAGLPVAVGAAVAAPDRAVIALQADGSAAYTCQALWTMARESLNVTVVLCANRSYRILQGEASRYGPEVAASALFDLNGPALDWVAISNGFGVPAVSVDRAEDLTVALSRALGEPGPHLVEAVLP
jgi:acetolactate synthase-1/2/3 large subunit